MKANLNGRLTKLEEKVKPVAEKLRFERRDGWIYYYLNGRGPFKLIRASEWDLV